MPGGQTADAAELEQQSTSARCEEACEHIVAGVNDDDCRYGCLRLQTKSGRPSKALQAELRKMKTASFSGGSSSAGNESDADWFTKLDDDGFRQLTAQEYFDWRVTSLAETFRSEIVSVSKW